MNFRLFNRNGDKNGKGRASGGRVGALRSWRGRFAVAALTLAAAFVGVAPALAFEIVGVGATFFDAAGNVAFRGRIDSERTAATVEEGAEKPTTVFWRSGEAEGAYPYAALDDKSKATVDQELAEFAERSERVKKSAAERKANWAKEPTLPLGFIEVRKVRGKKVALVVGCGDEKTNERERSAADARLLSERLRECGFEIVLLTGQDATRSNIEGALKTLEEKKDAGMIFVAFSGAGTERNGEIYCLPTDVLKLPFEDVDEDIEVEEKCVSLNDFAQDLERRTPGRLKAFFFDVSRYQPQPARVDAAANLPANAWTLCAGLIAYGADFDGKRHGIFSYCFAEGLTERGDANGDGVVTLMEAFLYARAYSISETEIKRNALAPTAPFSNGPVAYGPLADVAMRYLNAAPQETGETVILAK